MIFPITVLFLTPKYWHHTQRRCTAAWQASSLFCFAFALWRNCFEWLAWEELKMVLLLQMTPQNCSSPGPEAHTWTHRRNTHQSRERLSSQTEVWHLLYPTGPCWSQRHLGTVSMQLWEVGQLNTALRSRSGSLKWALPGIILLMANTARQSLWKDLSLKIGDRIYDSGFNLVLHRSTAVGKESRLPLPVQGF